MSAAEVNKLTQDALALVDAGTSVDEVYAQYRVLIHQVNQGDPNGDMVSPLQDLENGLRKHGWQPDNRGGVCHDYGHGARG